MREGGCGVLCGKGVRSLLLALCAGIAGFADPALGQSPADVPGGAQSFTAMGNEPGWRLDIGGGRMTLTADYGATKIVMPAPAAPEPIPGGRAYAGEASGRPVRVTVLDRICHDTMTGMPHPATVGIEFDGRKLDGCGGDPESLLRGGTWLVESIDGAPSIPDVKPTIAFGDDGSVSGHASCNGYSGAYALTGEGLTVSRLLSTMKACPPPLMQQEDAFLAVLRDVLRFERPQDGTLVLHAAGGRAIRAKRGE
jgi:heat shock protein HslJ